MSLREHPTSPTTGHSRRVDKDVGWRPVLWMLGIGIALMLTGALVASVSPITTAIWSGKTVGFLILALGWFVGFAIPGMLEVVEHPWATSLLRMLEHRFNHPRLVGVAMVWVGGVLPGVLSAYTLLHYPDPLLFISYAVFAIGLGLTVAIPLFIRRR